MARVFEDWEKSEYKAPTPTVEESDAAEKQRARNASAMAARTANQPVLISPTQLAAAEGGAIGAASIAAQMAAQAADVAPTPGSVADWRMGEEASMGAPKPPTVVASQPPTVVKTDSSEPDKGDGDKFPKAGTLLRYRPGRAGFRIPIFADGKGGEYEGAEQADPDYKPGGGGVQFVEYEYSKDFKKRRAKFFNPATGAFSYGEWEDAPMSKEEFDKQQAAKLAEEMAMNERRDAFALIEATMRSYGFNDTELKELIDYIQAGLLNPKLGANQLVLQLRQLPSYKARFAGNEERRARGLNALDEASYLRQENAYAETFRMSGLQRFVTRGQFANLIGNDISNTELGRRVKLGVERLQDADPAVLSQLRKYYNITDNDILAYVLNPKEVLPELEAKTTRAEIGATAAQFGLNADLARVTDLEKYGVDLTRARSGYEQIANRLPRATTLSDIYKQAGINYNQDIAEQEEFKGLASAKRARERLKELEMGSFGGAAGLARGALSGTERSSF